MYIACNCVPANERTFVTTEMQKFRQVVLDAHNERRNFIASGGEKDRNYDSAANMHILRYDLELEYIAKCYVMWKNFTLLGNYCNEEGRYCKHISPGQNIAERTRIKWTENMEEITNIINSWFGELGHVYKGQRIKFINEFSAQYFFTPWNFARMIWATHERVGCARAEIWDDTTWTSWTNYTFAFVCNYAGPDESCGDILVGHPVYIAGKPCSKCGKTKCNKDLGGKYDALCGEDNNLTNLTSGANKRKNSENIVNIIFIVSIIFVVTNKCMD